MALLHLGDSPVLSGLIHRSLRGVWTAELEVDADRVPSGRMTVAGAGLSIVGTVVNALSWNDRQRARLVGGAGGMGRVLGALWYAATTVRTIVRDILTKAGEQLAATSSASILGRTIGGWARFAGTAGALLDQLLAVTSPGAIWRTLADGTIWIGVPTWPAVTTTLVALDNLGDNDLGALAGEDLSIDAGTTTLGRRVGRVRHEISATGLRTEALWIVAA